MTKGDLQFITKIIGTNENNIIDFTDPHVTLENS